MFSCRLLYGRILLPEVIQNRLRLGAGDHSGKRRRIRLLDRLHAAEMLQQSPGRAFPDAGNFPQFSGAVAHLAPLAMEGDRKAVGFVADQLHQMQHRRVMIERDRFALPDRRRR